MAYLNAPDAKLSPEFSITHDSFSGGIFCII
ncbi:hypothetical protein T11_11309 [Trichinella zimbabwensis]|uniref:Uncharacterized protein n=1 Tax=Trichinella zimbabwensis TaxID=268475 RepID=A0A0V1GDM2_9BILA|nr:hypothetical protein T11_11309 [Trichinella zimbabwensis]